MLYNTSVMGKSLFDQTIELLNKNNIEYKKYEHEPVFNSETAAKAVGAGLAEGAKALILLGDGQPLMIVVSGADRVDFKKVKKMLKIKNLEMATQKEVKRITGVEVGAVPPLGNLFKIPLYVDTNIGSGKEIVFSAGSHSVSIRMKYYDFKSIANPIMGNFAK